MTGARADEAIREDLRKLQTVVQASALTKDAVAVVLGGSFANGNPAYTQQLNELVCLSDFDMIAVGAISRPEGDALAQEIMEVTGIRATVGVLDEADLKRRSPTQFWWELANNGIALKGREFAAESLARFKAAEPTLDDARQILVNRFAELHGATGLHRGVAGLRSMQAAIDAWLICERVLPATLTERWALAAPRWPDEALALKRFVDERLVREDECDSWAQMGLDALRRAATTVPDLTRVAKPRDVGTEIAHQRLLLSHRIRVFGYPVEIVVHRQLARSILSGRPPRRQALRAWFLIHRGQALPSLRERDV